MIHFTSDWHLEHFNIIKYCDRPFKSPYTMRQEIIRLFNTKVHPGDITFHLGDFTMLGASQVDKVKNVISKLNGVHHLILGNHDRLKPFQYVERLGFASVHTSFWLEYEDVKFILVHDPSAYCVLNKDEFLLHGHIHNLYKDLLPGRRVINVGVDVWDFKPISIEEIINLINERNGDNNGEDNHSNN